MKSYLQPAILFFLLVADSSAGSIQYVVTDIGGSNSIANAISGNGLVVGESSFSTGMHAFLYRYSDDTIIDLGNLPRATESRAWGVNSSGQVVGQTFAYGPGPNDPFIYNAGQMTDMAFLSPFAGTARAINDAGQVVGSFSSTPGGNPQHAFLYSSGQMQDLGVIDGWQSVATAINASGQVAGNTNISWGSTNNHAFLYAHGVMTDLGSLPGFADSYATAISADGQVVGYVHNDPFDNEYRAFLYSNGVMSDLGDLGGIETYARSINSRGQIVGSGYYSDVYSRHAFLYDRGTMTDLNNLIDSGSGWILKEANAINDLGQIVGEGINPNGDSHAFLLTPTGASVPEPASIMLVAVGMFALTAFSARKSKQRGK